MSLPPKTTEPQLIIRQEESPKEQKIQPIEVPLEVPSQKVIQEEGKIQHIVVELRHPQNAILSEEKKRVNKQQIEQEKVEHVVDQSGQFGVISFKPVPDTTEKDVNDEPLVGKHPQESLEELKQNSRKEVASHKERIKNQYVEKFKLQSANCDIFKTLISTNENTKLVIKANKLELGEIVNLKDLPKDSKQQVINIIKWGSDCVANLVSASMSSTEIFDSTRDKAVEKINVVIDALISLQNLKKENGGSWIQQVISKHQKVLIPILKNTIVDCKNLIDFLEK